MRLRFSSSRLLVSWAACASMLCGMACNGDIGSDKGSDGGSQPGDAQAARDAQTADADGGKGPGKSRDAQAANDDAAATGGGDSDGSRPDGSTSEGDAGQPEAGSTLLVGIGAWAFIASSGDGSTWNYCGDMAEAVDPHSPSLLRDVSYGDGVFIAVGGDANGMVMRSLDGVHWEKDLHPTTNCGGEVWPESCKSWMGGVAYGDDTWLAGGGNGALMRSTDGGKTWTGLHPSPGLAPIRDMTFGNGRFVAATDGGVAVSTDKGATWTSFKLSTASMKIAGGGGTFITWGATWNGSGFNRFCFVSTDDAETWPACDAAVLEASSFAYDGTEWGASLSSSFATSSNGKTWSVQTGSVPGKLLHDGEKWFAVGGGQVKTGATLSALAGSTSIATGVPDATWTIGRVLDKNLPVEGVPACEDNR